MCDRMLPWNFPHTVWNDCQGFFEVTIMNESPDSQYQWHAKELVVQLRETIEKSLDIFSIKCIFHILIMFSKLGILRK